MSLKSVHQLLQLPQLARIKQHIELMEQINTWMKPFLPPPLPQKCSAITWENGRLTLALSENLWALTLRNHLPKIQKYLISTKHLKSLIHIDYIICPDTPQTTSICPSTLHAFPMDQDIATIISQTANNIENVQLKKALLRLARHHH